MGVTKPLLFMSPSGDLAHKPGYPLSGELRAKLAKQFELVRSQIYLECSPQGDEYKEVK